MPKYQEFKRHSNQLMISKIILTSNKLTDDIAEKYISKSTSEKLYIGRVDENGVKYWKGFNEEYVYSYKTRKNTKKGVTTSVDEFDKGIDELTENNNIISKIFKNTYVIRKNATSNPVYVDTFIMPDINLICIFGSKQYIDEPQKELYSFLDNEQISYYEINITHDFLLWVLWKLYLEDNISEEISLDYYEDLSVGLNNDIDEEFDDSPINIKTEGASHILPSLPICYGLFARKSIKYFKGDFNYKDNLFSLRVNIYSEQELSTIHILSNGCLEGLHYSEKLYLVLPLLYNLSTLVSEWTNYDSCEKYPDEKYLNELFKKAQLDFKETKEAFEELKEEYAKKRDE